MDLLLDTHALIWFLNGDPDNLSAKARAAKAGQVATQ